MPTPVRATTDADPIHGGLSLSGDTLLAGGGSPETGFSTNTFVRAGGTWARTSTLAHPDGRWANPIRNGDRLLLASPPEWADRLGVVHLFTKSGPGADWSLQASMTPDEQWSGDDFAQAAAFSDDTIVVGARGSGGTPTGKVYFFGFEHPLVIVSQPVRAMACPGGEGTFSVAVSGTPPLVYRWQLEAFSGYWIDLSTSPVALPCGGNASASSSDQPTTSIGISGCRGPFRVRCIVSNACGPITSAPARFTVCAADLDCSGTLTVQDIFEFLNAWMAGDARADFYNSGTLEVQDIIDFVDAWFVGC